MGQEKGSGSTLHGIQALRFFAALGVVVHHVFAYAESTGALVGYLEPSRVAAAGVIMFFVISGFLMAMVSENASPVRFLIDRAMRIYPGLWLAVAIAVVLRLIAFKAAGPFNWIRVLTLYPSGQIGYPLNVEWTLVFEIIFYVVVALLCLLPSVRLRQAVVLAWGAKIILDGYGGGLGTFGQMVFAHLNLAFIIGMLAWWSRNAIPAFNGYFGVALAAAVFLIGRYGVASWLVGHVLQSLSAAILVIVASRSTLFARETRLTRLGDASYGLYLLHVPIIVTAFVVFRFHGWAWVGVVFALAVMGGVAFGNFEHRLHRKLKKLDQARLRQRAA